MGTRSRSTLVQSSVQGVASLLSTPLNSEGKESTPFDTKSDFLSLPVTFSSQSVQTFTVWLRETRQNKRRYQTLLGLTGDDAQMVLDDLQAALESPLPCHSDRVIAMEAMTRLARRSGLYPRCFRVLTELHLLGNKPIGVGGFGNVWKARLGDRVTCVKTLRIGHRENRQRLFKALLREGLIWAQSSSHPNIVPFLGIRVGKIDTVGIGLVSDWMPNGNIVEYLEKNPVAPRMNLIYDTASGLQHLHSLSIVHGDIKGRNILVNAAGRACLADFGLANVLVENIPNWSSLSSGSSHCGGTLRWQAPELLCEEVDTGIGPSNTLASDIYSFACTIYEILADREPFHEIQNRRQLLCKRFTHPDLQPARRSEGNLGKGLTDEVWWLMESGWHPDPAQRPTMQDMCERLRKLMNC